MKKKLKTCLYLDDVRTPAEQLPEHEPWHVVRNFDEFKKYIEEKGVPQLISFDHDLAEEHMNDYVEQVSTYGYQHPRYENYTIPTGIDCAQWLIGYIQENALVLNKCCVHSHNPVGAANLMSLLNGFKKHMGWEQDCFQHRFPFTINN